MTHSPASNYHAVPFSEDQANHSDVHRREAVVGGNDHFSASEWIQIEASTKWIYFLLGCVILLPWNALANGTPFFLSRLVGSPFYLAFSSSLSSVFMLTKLVSQFYSTFTSKQSSPSRRIFACVIAAMFLVASLCLSTFIRGTPLTFFVFTLFTATFLAATSGYVCTAVYARASLFGISCLQSVMSGQAAIAVAVSAVQVTSLIVSLWGSSSKFVLVEGMRTDDADDQAEELAARMFFGVSVAFLAVTLAMYTWLTKQPFYKSLVSTLEQYGGETGDVDELSRLVSYDRRNPQAAASSRVYHVCRQNWRFMFSIAYVFAVTLAVFPATTVFVRPVNSGIQPMLFTAIHFLVYNTGDLAGRYTCSFPRLIVWSSNKILALSLLRTLFIPLVLLCNIRKSATISPVFPIISSDFLFMTILLTMGYTNGYVSTTATLSVSSLEHNSKLEEHRQDVDIAATLSGSFAIAGLAVGSLSSFFVLAVV